MYTGYSKTPFLGYQNPVRSEYDFEEKRNSFYSDSFGDIDDTNIIPQPGMFKVKNRGIDEFKIEL